jgi:hypothetical protein
MSPPLAQGRGSGRGTAGRFNHLTVHSLPLEEAADLKVENATKFNRKDVSSRRLSLSCLSRSITGSSSSGKGKQTYVEAASSAPHSNRYSDQKGNKQKGRGKKGNNRNRGGKKKSQQWG